MDEFVKRYFEQRMKGKYPFMAAMLACSMDAFEIFVSDHLRK